MGGNPARLGIGGKRVGYTGAGNWSKKIDRYAGEDALAFKAFDLKPGRETPLNALQHYTPDDLENIEVPDSFYRNLDINVIANNNSEHASYVLDAIDRMPEDSLVVFEKALDARPPENMGPEELVELAELNGVEVMASEHYHKKPAIQKAGERIEQQDLQGIQEVNVYGKERCFDEERSWITLPSEGGITLDWGPHGAAIALTNLDAEIPDDPVLEAIGYETEFGSTVRPENFEQPLKYPGAFEARVRLEGERFQDGAELQMLMGKGFNEDKKKFEIIGEDDGDEWMLEGYFGGDGNQPMLTVCINKDRETFDLSGETAAKERLVDEYLEVYDGKEPEFSLTDQYDSARIVDQINREIGLFDDKGPEVEQWDTGDENLNPPDRLKML